MTGGSPFPASQWSNHVPIASRTRWSGAPPSWPPAYQSMRTVPPAAAICRAVASAWSSPNNVSASPWTTSVGAEIRSVTDAGEERRRSSAVAGESRPVVAASV